MKTLAPGRLQAKGSESVKARVIEDYLDYREEVLARLMPEQPRPSLSAADVLRTARENCSRSLAYYQRCQQSSVKVRQQKPSLVKLQYGRSSTSEESCQDNATTSASASARQSESGWIEEPADGQDDPLPWKAQGQGPLVARSLGRSWTGAFMPTILVEFDTSQDYEEVPAADSPAAPRTIRRLQRQSATGSPEQGQVSSASQPVGFRGGGGAVAAAAGMASAAPSPGAFATTRSPRVSSSAASAGWLVQSDALEPQQIPAGAASSLKAATREERALPPNQSSCRDGAAAAAAQSEGCGDSAGCDDNGDGDDASPPPAADLLVKPPVLDRALSYLRSQSTQGPPRLRRLVYKSLDHLTDANMLRSEGLAAARRTADNLGTIGGDGGGSTADIAFASTGGSVGTAAGAAATAEAGEDDDEDFFGGWVVSQSRGAPSVLSGAPAGAPLRPTPRGGSRSVVAAPVIPSRARSLASPGSATSCSSHGGPLNGQPQPQPQAQAQQLQLQAAAPSPQASSLQHLGEQQRRLLQQLSTAQRLHQEMGSDSATAATMTVQSEMPPQDATRRVRKVASSLASMSSVHGSAVGPLPAAPSTASIASPTSAMAPSPVPSASGIPSTTSMSHLLLSLDRPAWKVSRADSSQLRSSDSAWDFVRTPSSVSRKASAALGNKAGLLPFTSFGRKVATATGGGGGGGGAWAHDPERSCQSFTAGMQDGPAVSYGGGDSSAAHTPEHRGGSMGGGPGTASVLSPRSCCTVVSSPTGLQTRPGSTSFISRSNSQSAQQLQQPQSGPGESYTQSQGHNGHVRFRHVNSGDFPASLTGALGSPASSPIPGSRAAAAEAAVAPAGLLAATATSEVGSRRLLSQPASDSSRRAASLAVVAGGSIGGGAAAATTMGGMMKLYLPGAAAESPLSQSPIGRSNPTHAFYQQPQPPQVISGSSNAGSRHRRTEALLRKLSDGENSAVAGSVGVGAGGGALSAVEEVPASSGGRPHQHQHRAHSGGVAGGGLRSDGDMYDRLDSGQGLMARLFKTLNDLRRQEAALEEQDD